MLLSHDLDIIYQSLEMKTYICQLIKSSKKFIEKSYKILKTIVSITEHNMQYLEIFL